MVHAMIQFAATLMYIAALVLGIYICVSLFSLALTLTLS
jgi:hypothetical protein